MQEVNIACVSDLHGNIISPSAMPDADILIVVSATNRGTQSEYILLQKNFENWGSKYEYIVYVPGKHDIGLQDNYQHFSGMLTEVTNVIVLVNTDVRLLGLNIWGAPTSKYDLNWAYTIKGERDRENIFKDVPLDTDILVTYLPPEGILDQVNHRRGAVANVGCKYIREAVERVRPTVHIFGGAPGSYGREIDGLTSYVNASLVNEDRQLHNDIQVISVNN